MLSIPKVIDALEKALADPGLYARDPKTFNATMAKIEAQRDLLEAAEADWLALEEKKTGL